MKATELMIGDWVLYSDKPVKVLQLSEKSDYDWVKPIHLSREILEKNGWEKHATYGNAEDETLEVIYMLYQHSFEVVLNNKEAISIRHFVSEEDDGYDKLLIEYRDNGYKPMYVHTLQHALRLCGLDVLADNFKL